MKRTKIAGNKKIAYVLVGAGAVALTGIAFSSWVISTQPDPVTTEDPITVTVAEVNDISMEIQGITVSFPDGKSGIRFDNNVNDQSGDIIYGSEENGGEQLTFTISFSVTNALVKTDSTYKFADQFGGIGMFMTATDGTSSQWSVISTAVNSSYIELPMASDSSSPTTITASKDSSWSSGSSVKAESTSGHVSAAFSAGDPDTTLKVVLTCSFAWGDVFGNLNPGIWENTSGNNVETAKSALTLLQGASNLSFKVTLSIIAK